MSTNNNRGMKTDQALYKRRERDHRAERRIHRVAKSLVRDGSAWCGPCAESLRATCPHAVAAPFVEGHERRECACALAGGEERH